VVLFALIDPSNAAVKLLTFAESVIAVGLGVH
jgi:hypothetical protein